MIEFGRAMGKIALVAHGRFAELDEDVRLVPGAFQNVISALGSAEGMDLRFEAPTLWGTASFIGDEVVRLSDKNAGIVARIDFFHGSMQLVIKKVNDGSKTEDAANSKLLKILALVMSWVQSLNPEPDRICTHIAQLETMVATTINNNTVSKKKQRSTKPEDGLSDNHGTIDDLMAMLTADACMTDDCERGISYERHDPGVIDHQAGTDWDHMEKSISRESAEVGLIIADVGSQKACAEDKSIKFRGLGLRFVQECHAWIDGYFKGIRYGLIMDPLLILDRIFGSDDLEAESQFKILESRVKLKITTGAEAAAIKALHFNRPRLFHKGRMAMTRE
jgi:hypothetical protein